MGDLFPAHAMQFLSPLLSQGSGYKGRMSRPPEPATQAGKKRTLRAFFLSRLASCRSLLYFSLRTTLFLMKDVRWPAVTGIKSACEIKLSRSCLCTTLFLMNDVRWPAVEGGKRVFGSSLLHCFNSAIVLLMNEVLWPANQC